MAGVHSPTQSVSNGAIYGARAAASIHAQGTQENSMYKSSSQNGSRNALNGSNTRTPLTNVAPNKNAGQLAPYGNKDNGISRSGSEADSLLDLYGDGGSQRDLSNLDSDIPENMYRPEEYIDNPEGWIHRDKLAKIESEELQAAGINLANARKSISRGTSRRSNSRDRSEKGTGAELSQRPTREEKMAQRAPPVLEEENNSNDRNWDLRSPEEIAADDAIRSQPQSLRKAGSRIPVLTSSPLPIPAERVERDTPLPRKRTLSNSMSPDDGTPMPKIRQRQNSSSNGMILDEGESVSAPGYRSGSTPSSPSKLKVIKPTATSSPASAAKKTIPGQRKSSVPAKSGLPSSTGSPNQRPGTRSGENDRPRTAVNRPEGDPPWLATMYKPDPRLPPDQQIIPTHARKQQQAQWTEAGAVPSTYDREFTPLAVNTREGLVKLPSPAAVAEKPGDHDAWPLKPIPNVRGGSDQRPGTSGSQTAGYSTMPKVQNLPIKSPVASISQSPVRGTFPGTKDGGPPPRMQHHRFDEEDQTGKKEKGCLGCCTVM